MIAVSHLTRRFGPVLAVDDVSFRLERGEVVGFLGVNGAGKSTTMRVLTGFLPATRGTVEVAGFDVLRDSLEVRRRIGYLPESVPLYRELRVQEMLAFQGRLHGLGRAAIRRRVGEVLARVGLEELRRAPIGRLSKGQRQRVGLAVALLPDPEVLVLDEPTSGLDPLQRLEVRGLVQELAAARTVLVSSHILPEIESVCPRVIVLHRGRVVADGSRADLARSFGDGARVRVAALVPAGASLGTALAGLPGVRAVEVVDAEGGEATPESSGAAGSLQRVALACEGDLRPAVGALARERGWTLHELAYDAPTLERLFARIAVGHDEGGAAERGGAAA